MIETVIYRYVIISAEVLLKQESFQLLFEGLHRVS